jgi:hypothetical protein
VKNGEASFTTDRSMDAQPYRAISPLAIAASALGAVSAMALVHPFFWFLPVVAVVVSVMALRTIARNPDSLVGRKAALMGLAAAVFFGIWAPTSLALQRAVIPRNARSFAEYWLELVREGRVHEAHQWSVPAEYRVPEDVDLKQFYDSDTDAKGDLDVFLEDDVLRVLVRAGRAARPRFVRTVVFVGNEARSRTTLDFEVATNDQTVSPFDVRTVIERTRAAEDGSVQWRMVQVRSRKLEGR